MPLEHKLVGNVLRKNGKMPLTLLTVFFLKMILTLLLAAVGLHVLLRHLCGGLEKVKQFI